jgi:hypothetical protein
LLLQEAIQSPEHRLNESNDDLAEKVNFDVAQLPNGSNTFFRQLDHMIATLCNEEFIRLYTYIRDMSVVGSTFDGTKQQNQEPISSDIVQLYSNMKAAIFSRYRTVSELLGVILLQEAQKIPINCMLETSGRDVAMFHYIDHFFPSDRYNKLALHFTINELQHAKTSVDQRMVDEIQSGINALEQNSIFQIINTNVGGPYGSEVLSDIQGRQPFQVISNDVIIRNLTFQMISPLQCSGFRSSLEGKRYGQWWCRSRLVQGYHTN